MAMADRPRDASALEVPDGRSTKVVRNALDASQLAVSCQYGKGQLQIGGILAACGFAIYFLWWATLVVIRRVPMIGSRHKHANWDRLNRH